MPACINIERHETFFFLEDYEIECDIQTCELFSYWQLPETFVKVYIVFKLASC